MRAISLGVLFAVAACGWAAPVAIQPADKAAPKDTRAAEFTRDRYLKVKVTGELIDVMCGATKKGADHKACAESCAKRARTRTPARASTSLARSCAISAWLSRKYASSRPA